MRSSPITAPIFWLHCGRDVKLPVELEDKTVLMDTGQALRPMGAQAELDDLMAIAPVSLRLVLPQSKSQDKEASVIAAEAIDAAIGRPKLYGADAICAPLSWPPGIRWHYKQTYWEGIDEPWTLRASDIAPLRQFFADYSPLDMAVPGFARFIYAFFRPLVAEMIFDHVCVLESQYASESKEGGNTVFA